MAKITVQVDCENAPKKEFLRDFEVAFAHKNAATILQSIDDNIYWEMMGDRVIQGKAAAENTLRTMLDGTMKELTIENIITHGDTGCVNGTMIFADGSTFGFCDVFTFTSHAKDAKIKKLQSYVIEIKQSL